MLWAEDKDQGCWKTPTAQRKGGGREGMAVGRGEQLPSRRSNLVAIPWGASHEWVVPLSLSLFEAPWCQPAVSFSRLFTHTHTRGIY